MVYFVSSPFIHLSATLFFFGSFCFYYVRFVQPYLLDLWKQFLLIRWSIPLPCSLGISNLYIKVWITNQMNNVHPPYYFNVICYLLSMMPRYWTCPLLCAMFLIISWPQDFPTMCLGELAGYLNAERAILIKWVGGMLTRILQKAILLVCWGLPFTEEAFWTLSLGLRESDLGMEESLGVLGTP